MKNLPYKKELNKTFEYKNGKLYWKIEIPGVVQIGDEVKYECKDSKYCYVLLDDRKYNYAKIVYSMFNEDFQNSSDTIEYIDNNRFNFNIENLKKISRSNLMFSKHPGINKSSGIRGVYLERRNSKWYSQITCKGKVYRLGYFSKKEDASKAYSEKAKELFV